MSAATLVPETWELIGDDARETLKRTGRMRLVRDAFVRFRASDGFSHARSLAFVTSLLLVQGVIVLVGVAAALGETDLSASIVRAITEAVRTVDTRGVRRLSPFTIPSFLVNLAAGHVSIRHGFKGPLGAPVTAA